MAPLPSPPCYCQAGTSKAPQSCVIALLQPFQHFIQTPARESLPCPLHLASPARQLSPCPTCRPPPPHPGAAPPAQPSFPSALADPVQDSPRHPWEVSPPPGRRKLPSSHRAHLARAPAPPFAQRSAMNTPGPPQAPRSEPLREGSKPILITCMPSSPQPDIQQVLKKAPERMKMDSPPRKRRPSGNGDTNKRV